MSWTATKSGVTIDEIALMEPVPKSLDGGALEQFELAIRTATVLARSGCCGDPQQFRFNVYLSGHSNPGHEPAAGWANDDMSVRVSQCPVPA